MIEWFYNVTFYEDEHNTDYFNKELKKIENEIENTKKNLSSYLYYFKYSFQFVGAACGDKGTNPLFDLDFKIFNKIAEISDKESYGMFYHINQDIEESFNVWIMRKGKVIKVNDPFFSPYEEKLIK